MDKFQFLEFSRENEKIRIRRLSKQALQAWHKISQSSLQEAVMRFAVAIGLHQGSGDSNVNEEGEKLDNCDELEGWLCRCSFESQKSLFELTDCISK